PDLAPEEVVEPGLSPVERRRLALTGALAQRLQVLLATAVDGRGGLAAQALEQAPGGRHAPLARLGARVGVRRGEAAVRGRRDLGGRVVEGRAAGGARRERG